MKKYIKSIDVLENRDYNIIKDKGWPRGQKGVLIMNYKEIVEKYDMTITMRDGKECLMARRNAKSISKSLNLQIRDEKANIIAYLHQVEEEKKAEEARKQAEKEAMKQAFINGKTIVKAVWYDGEYLSGWEVFGDEAKELESIGAAKYVEGWGYKVDNKMIETLGSEFTYTQVVEYMNLENQKKEEEKKEAEKKEESRKQAIFQIARETEEKQELSHYLAPCNDPKEECSTDLITTWAMPDGTTKTTREHTR